MEERNLYEKLKAQKEAGIELDFNKITRDELYQLFHKECIADSLIADLYNITKNDVKRKRYKWGLRQNVLTLEDVLNEYFKR